MARRGENIYKRKDGRYEGRYVVGKKANGQTKFGYVFARQYAEARSKLIEAKAARLAVVETGMPVCRRSVGEWMRHWMEEDVRGMVKASSWQTYQNQMNRHILPRLGGLRLCTVTPAVVYEFVEELHEKELADSRSTVFTGYCRRGCGERWTPGFCAGIRVRRSGFTGHRRGSSAC